MSVRDPWFDNAKMALVTLVVVGHSIVLLPDSTVHTWLYDALYAWHVPAFVFVTGYLSRSFDYTPRRLWLLVRTVAVPYVIFECAMALFRIHLGGEELDDIFRDPHWPLWYLSALFFWRLATPVFTRLPGGARTGLPLALAISLVGGAVAGSTLDVARTVGLLPFFVLGFYVDHTAIARLRDGDLRRAGAAALGAVTLSALALGQWASTEWLYYRTPYDELGVSDLRGMAIRTGVMVVGLVGGIAFFALVPARMSWFTRMGEATLVVYLFHGFVLKTAEYAGYSSWTAAHPVLGYPVTVLAAVAIALGLAWHPVASRLGHLVDPLGYGEARVERAAVVAAARREADRIEAEIIEREAEAVPLG